MKNDIFFNSRRKLGLYPIKAKHILTWFDGDYFPSEDEIDNLDRERDLAARDFLKNELKWTHDTHFTTKYSIERRILWLTFDDENIVKALRVSQAQLERNNIRLLDYTPPWAHERKKTLEIKCRLKREENLALRTQVRLGKSNFILMVKNQGDSYYKEININSFEELPDFNFELDLNLTPTSPPGRPSFNSDDEEESDKRSRKRKNRSPNNSPPPQTRKPKINDTSYDNPLNLSGYKEGESDSLC